MSPESTFLLQTKLFIPLLRSNFILRDRLLSALEAASNRRSRRVLTDLRATALCFTTDEINDFINSVMKLKLIPDDVLALKNRTEGWIAGLQMV